MSHQYYAGRGSVFDPGSKLRLLANYAPYGHFGLFEGTINGVKSEQVRSWDEIVTLLPPKLYIAARLTNYKRVVEYRDHFKAYDISLSCDWAGHQTNLVAQGKEETKTDFPAIAKEEHDAIREAGVLMLVHPVRQSAYIEFGMAVAQGKECIVLNPDENDDSPFYSLPNVTVCRTEKEALQTVVDKCQNYYPKQFNLGRLVFDFDDVICKGGSLDYSKAEPYWLAIANINLAYRLGFTIVVATARYMARCDGNASKAHESGYKEAQEWLDKHKVPYESIHFGKPSSMMYVDDKALKVNSANGHNDWNGFWHEVRKL